MKHVGHEMETYHKAVDKHLPFFLEQLELIRNSLLKLTLQGGAMEGQAATAIDQYINEVPLDVINKFMNAINSYLRSFDNAYTRFNNEVDVYAKYIDDEYLYGLAEHMNKYTGDFQDLHEIITSEYMVTLHTGSPVINTPIPNFVAVNDSMLDSKKAVTNAMDIFQEFNEAHINDLAEVKELLQEIKRICLLHSESKLQNGEFTYVSVGEIDYTLIIAFLYAVLGKDIAKFLSIDEDTMYVISTIVSVDENGNLTYNFAVVRELLQKDVSELSASEVSALSIVYLTMQNSADGLTREENLERFLACGYRVVEIELPTDDGVIRQSCLQVTDAFIAVAAVSNSVSGNILTMMNEGYITPENMSAIRQDLLEKKALMQITITCCGSLAITSPSILKKFETNVTTGGFSPIQISENDGYMEILAATGIKGDADSLTGGFFFYGDPVRIGGASGVGYSPAHDVMGEATNTHLEAMGYNAGKPAWFASEVGDFAISEVSTNILETIFNGPGIPVIGGSLFLGGLFSLISDSQDAHRVRIFSETMSQSTLIGDLGGDIYATHINGQTIINHTNYASSESYLYTGFFASQYQEQYPGLTPTPARMILTNLADGGAPLDFEVCGYTDEQQVAMAEDYTACYTSNLRNDVKSSDYVEYERAVVETIFLEGYGNSIADASNQQLQQSVELTQSNFIQGEE